MCQVAHGLVVIVGNATGCQHLSQKLEIVCEGSVVVLNKCEVVQAVLGVATGIEGLREAFIAGEQKLRHDTVDNDVAGSDAAVLVVLEGEVDVERVVPGTRLLLAVECFG